MFTHREAWDHPYSDGDQPHHRGGVMVVAMVTVTLISLISFTAGLILGLAFSH